MIIYSIDRQKNDYLFDPKYRKLPIFDFIKYLDKFWQKKSNFCTLQFKYNAKTSLLTRSTKIINNNILKIYFKKKFLTLLNILTNFDKKKEIFARYSSNITQKTSLLTRSTKIINNNI